MGTPGLKCLQYCVKSEENRNEDIGVGIQIIPGLSDPMEARVICRWTISGSAIDSDGYRIVSSFIYKLLHE